MSAAENKTVQQRVLAYSEAIGWTIVSREEAEIKKAGLLTRHSGEIAGKNTRAPLSLFFDNQLDANVQEIDPRYAEAEGALLGRFHHLHIDISGNPPPPKPPAFPTE